MPAIDHAANVVSEMCLAERTGDPVEQSQLGGVLAAVEVSLREGVRSAEAATEARRLSAGFVHALTRDGFSLDEFPSLPDEIASLELGCIEFGTALRMIAEDLRGSPEVLGGLQGFFEGDVAGDLAELSYVLDPR